MPDTVGKVYRMEKGARGIWITFRKTTVICLYDTDYYIQLLQLDYTTLLPPTSLKECKSGQDQRVTALLATGGTLALGTGMGNIHLYSVSAAVANPAQRARALAATGVDSVTEFRGRSGSGGLLSSISDDQARPDRRRPTMFAHTVRAGRHRKNGNSPGVYKLDYKESLKAPSLSPTESVRLLLSLR